MNNLDKMPPVNLDAERGVLASMMLLSETVDDVTPILRPTDFYDEAHHLMFAALLEMHGTGGKLDPLLLIERLKKQKELERVGGAAYIAEVLNSQSTARHAVYYANIVAEKSTLRQLIFAGTDIVADAYNPDADAKQQLSTAESKVFGILDDRPSERLVTIGEALQEAMDRYENNKPVRGLSTGYADLDKQIGGFRDSELIILAARPSMGKSALALNIAENVAIDSGVPVLIVSLEMGTEQLCDRLLSSRACVDSLRMRNDTLSSHDRQDIIKAANVISQAPILIDDTPSQTITEIAAKSRRLKRQDKLRLIIIDYLQLIEPANTRDPREQQVAQITKRLKALARELQVPILCLAQLNRKTEEAKNKRPVLSNLRESGAIEQDADVVIFIHRQEYYEQDEKGKDEWAGKAEIRIAKHRNGPTGMVEMVWRKEYMRFETANKIAQDCSGYDPALDAWNNS